MIKKTPKGWLVISYEGKKLGVFMSLKEAQECFADYERKLKSND